MCALYRGEDAQYELGKVDTKDLLPTGCEHISYHHRTDGNIGARLVETVSSTLIEAMKMAFDKVAPWVYHGCCVIIYDGSY